MVVFCTSISKKSMILTNLDRIDTSEEGRDEITSSCSSEKSSSVGTPKGVCAAFDVEVKQTIFV